MDLEKLEKFKRIFEEEHNTLLSRQVTQKNQQALFVIPREELLDDTDRSSIDFEQAMQVRFFNRESQYMKKIADALERIREGSFGICEDCEEPIELKRLEARPITQFCLKCKESQEGREKQFWEGTSFWRTAPVHVV